MKVLVDTDVWSEAFRKRKGRASKYVAELHRLVEEFRVQMIGPIRQEILSGIREESTFRRIRDALSPFSSPFISDLIYIQAAEFFNHARSKGIQGSNTDFLICACGTQWGFPILTKDKDFARFAKLFSIQLHSIRKDL